MDKYEEMALKLIDYELKRFDHWKAETEHSLPLLMKRPLLALLTSEKPHLQVTFGLYHSLTVAYSLMLNFTILYILQPPNPPPPAVAYSVQPLLPQGRPSQNSTQHQEQNAVCCELCSRNPGNNFWSYIPWTAGLHCAYCSSQCRLTGIQID